MFGPDEIIGMLEEKGVPYSLIEHKRVFSIAELDEIDAEEKDAIVKNIVLCDDKKRSFFFLTVPPHVRVDLKALRKCLSSRPLSFLDGNRLHELLKIGKGEATPFCLLNDEENLFSFILDRSLHDKRIGIHPNDRILDYTSFMDYDYPGNVRELFSMIMLHHLGIDEEEVH